MSNLEDLDNTDLEHFSKGNLEGMSDRGLKIISELPDESNTFQTDVKPPTDTQLADVVKRNKQFIEGINRTPGLENPKSIGQGLAQIAELPERGGRGLGVGLERLVAGDTPTKALERAAEATKTTYKAPEGEKLGSMVGGMAGASPLFLAASAMVPGANITKFGRLAQAALEAGAGAGISNIVGQEATKGEVSPSEVALATGIGAVTGPAVVKGVDYLSFVMPKIQKAMQTEINTFIYRAKKGLGIPQETGLVPFDLKEAVAKGQMDEAVAAKVSSDLFAQSVRKRGLNEHLKPENLDRFGLVSDPYIVSQGEQAIVEATTQAMVKAGQSPETAAIAAQTAMNSAIDEVATPLLKAHQDEVVNIALGKTPEPFAADKGLKPSETVAGPQMTAPPPGELPPLAAPLPEPLSPELAIPGEAAPSAPAQSQGGSETGVEPLAEGPLPYKPSIPGEPNFVNGVGNTSEEILGPIAKKLNKPIDDPVVRDAVISEYKTQLEKHFPRLEKEFEIADTISKKKWLRESAARAAQHLAILKEELPAGVQESIAKMDIHLNELANPQPPEPLPNEIKTTHGVVVESPSIPSETTEIPPVAHGEVPVSKTVIPEAVTPIQEPKKKPVSSKPLKASDDISTMRTAIPKKTTLPILKGFQVSSSLARTTDLETEIVKKTALKDGMYEFVGKNAELSRFDPKDYPVPKEKPATIVGTVNRDSFIKALDKVSLYSSNDKTRQVLEQAILEAKPSGEGRLIATDGRRMMVIKLDGKFTPGTHSFLMSKTAIAGYRGMSGDNLKITTTKTKDGITLTGLEGSDGYMTMKAVEGQYPKYEQVFPKVEKQYTISRGSLLEGLKQLAPYAKQDPSGQVNIRETADGWELSAGKENRKIVSIPTTSKEVAYGPIVEGAIIMPMRSESSAEGTIAAFQHQFLVDMAASFQGDTIYAGYIATTSPMQFSDQDISKLNATKLSKKDAKLQKLRSELYKAHEEYRKAKGQLHKEKTDAANEAFEAANDRVNELTDQIDELVNKSGPEPKGKTESLTQAAPNIEFETKLGTIRNGSQVGVSNPIPAMPLAGILHEIPAGLRGVIKSIDYETETVLVDFGSGPVRLFLDDLQPGPVAEKPKVDLSEYDMLGDLPSGVSTSSLRPQMATESKTADRVNKQRIIEHVETAFNVPVRSRLTKMRSGKNLGHYEIQPHLIRLRKYGDLEVLSHEAAHAIDRTLQKTLRHGWKEDVYNLSKNPKEAWRELKNLDYDQSKRRVTEGFAEYVRHLITTGQAQELAPNFNLGFQEWLKTNPGLKKDIEKFRDMYRIWMDQGSEARLLAQIDFKGEAGKQLKTGQKIENGWNWFRERFIDELDVLKRIDDDLKKRSIGLKPSRSPFAIATMVKQKARAIAHFMVTEAAVDWQGNVVGPSLYEILKPIEVSYGDILPESAAKALDAPQKIKSFIAYATARRAITLGRRGIDAGFDIADASHVFAKYDNPIWRKASDDLTKWSDTGIQWLIDSGALSQEEGDIVRELNPVYLRLKAVFVDEADAFRSGGSKMFTGQKGIKKIRGSGRARYNPLESMIEGLADTLVLSHKARVANLIYDLTDIPGMGKWVTKVPPPMEAGKYDIQTISDALKKDGWKISQIEEEGKKELDGVITLFMQGQQWKGKDNVVPVMRDGKRHFIELHPDIFRALQGLDHPQLNTVTKILAPFSRILRLGATTLKPSFSLIKNPLRDTQSYLMNTKKRTFNILSPLTGMYKELTAKPGDLAYRFSATGGSMSGMIGYDRAAVSAVYDEMLTSNLPGGKILKVVLHPLDAFRSLLSFPEAGPRITELDRMYAHYRATKPEWSETDAYIQAFNDAQDVTVNFSRAGSWGKHINQATAFFNAGAQGLDKIARVAKDNPAEFALRGLLFLTLPAVASWANNRKKQWYKNLQKEYRYGNYFFEIGNEVIRLPIPFETGVIFASMPVAILDEMGRSGESKGDTARAIGKLIANYGMPNLMPSAIGPVYDVARNKDFFNRPIESEGMKYSPIEDRKHDNTMAVSSAISKGLNMLGIEISPVQAEYLMQSYTGGALNQLRFTGGIKSVADIPVIGDIMLRAPEKPARQIENFFTELTALRQKKHVNSATDEELARDKDMEKIYRRIYQPHQQELQRLIKSGASNNLIRQEYAKLQEDFESVGIK